MATVRAGRSRIRVGAGLVALCGLLVACGGGSSSSSAPSTPAGGRVTLPGTEVRTLESKAAGRTYQLEISYPDHYATTPGNRYPVVYLLDAQWDTKLVRAIYENEVYDGSVPPLLVVGITYPGARPDYDSLRAHDLTPVKDADVKGSGGGPAFHRFLTTELIPYVESHFPVDPGRRILVGSSFGGIFALYSLFSDPTTFSGYVIGAPAMPFGGNATGTQEAAYAASRHDLPARVFIGVGSVDRLRPSVESFIDVLKGRHYTGLHLDTEIAEGSGHAGVRAEVFSRGLRYVFDLT